KQGDMLASSFSEFAEQTPGLYRALIAERDRYMAARLRDGPGPAREVLAVVGAGHLEGLARHLGEEQAAPTEVAAELETVKPASAGSCWPASPGVSPPAGSRSAPTCCCTGCCGPAGSARWAA